MACTRCRSKSPSIMVTTSPRMGCSSTITRRLSSAFDRPSPQLVAREMAAPSSTSRCCMASSPCRPSALPAPLCTAYPGRACAASSALLWMCLPCQARATTRTTSSASRRMMLSGRHRHRLPRVHPPQHHLRHHLLHGRRHPCRHRPYRLFPLRSRLARRLRCLLSFRHLLDPLHHRRPRHHHRHHRHHRLCDNAGA